MQYKYVFCLPFASGCFTKSDTPMKVQARYRRFSDRKFISVSLIGSSSRYRRTGWQSIEIHPSYTPERVTFNEKLIGKVIGDLMTPAPLGKVVGDLMTPAPLVVRESTNLEDAARLLLETKYCQLPVVDGDGKLTFNEKLIGKVIGDLMTPAPLGKVVGDLMTPAPLVVRESTNLEDAAREGEGGGGESGGDGDREVDGGGEGGGEGSGDGGIRGRETEEGLEAERKATQLLQREAAY
nr:cbs domain-containing protein cbsx2, chloroplastic [Quercus suber]